MKLFSNEKDNQGTSSQSKNPEGKKSGKQHPELKIISGKQISQPSSSTQKEVQPEPQKPLLPEVTHVVAILSGKGGVGKSTVAVNLALALAEKGFKVGLMDADVYGPSIPTMMGVKQQPRITEKKKLIPINQHDISLMSIGFMVEDEQAMIWRGPMLHSAMRQFLGDVIWGQLDYLFIDMPPGTGDVQLSLSQIASLRGAIVVTTPQDVALADVRRSIAMCNRMETPLLGIVENMSYYVNDSGEKIDIFGKGGGEKISHQLGTSLLGQIPIDPQICQCGDLGTPIIIGYPDSPQSLVFQQIANGLIHQIDQLDPNDELIIE